MELEIGDMYKMKMPGDLQISKDGRILAFVVGRMNRKRDEYNSRIYIYDGKLRAFTNGMKDSSPRFTEDGRYMVYYRALKEGGEIRKIPLNGGESEVVAKLEKGASNIKIDGDYIYFIAPVVE